MAKGIYQYKQIKTHQPNFVKNSKKYKRNRNAKVQFIEPNNTQFQLQISARQLSIFLSISAIIISIIATIYKGGF